MLGDTVVPSFGGFLRTGELSADVPGAGTWWFAIDVPAIPERSSTISIYATVGLGFEPSAIALVDAATGGATLGTFAGETWKAEVTKQIASRRWVLRVATPRAMQFSVAVEQHWHNPSTDPVVPPPVEFPRCDANAPDYTNPRCCRMAHCTMGTLQCKAKVISILPDRSGFEIDAGENRELMRRARASVRIHGTTVAHGTVRTVYETRAIVGISDGAASIEVGEGYVLLERPEACIPR